MKAIKRKVYFLFGATIFCTAVTAFILIFRSPGSGPGVCLPVMLPATTVSAVFFIRGYKKMKDAQLIVENQILRICPAVVNEDGTNALSLPVNVLEAIISCFGILLDSRIIKFNQGGIRLETVEIGGNFISFTYGNNKRMHNMQLLQAAIDNRELAEILEKFRYETGIVPVVDQMPSGRKEVKR